MRAALALQSAFGDSLRLRAEQKGSVAMNSLKTNSLKTDSLKTGSLASRHIDVRLRKIRSLKTSSFKANPPKMALATARVPKSFVKSIVPYGLVIASLALSGGAMATEAHAKTVKHVTPTHVVTHVARRHAVPAQQPDFVAQFFQGLFGGGGPVRVSRGSAATSDWVGVSSPDNSAATNTDSQAASDAEVQAIQQMNDENALNSSMQAAEQQNEAAQAAAIQTEINANNQ
jgi:hypothetical protein